MDPENCVPCMIIINACKKLGDSKYCKLLIEKFENRDINLDQFAKSISNKFGEDFKKETNKIMKKKGIIKD